ncbi:class I SAM-dependent methyltransferase [Pseudobacillus badius]|uniref:class I SAM-dependent methyltransferase n=1 Tax=Bacillus badius TaxID=1455 RepID=UPI0007B063C5|nr:class I SAM-dependent methyltransferase [Bacillus badius]KZN99026.1 methyltransferase [Bacillus badius]MED0664966.1 class I SAM-dependent methyltransferase [Bacillus badius]OCS83965.1 methyltransferase [Bacillus badius]OVE52741.1 SAM-dependent methyltransferase [Bacillus badius]TDW04759.1 methyltransferase family protein [Bacillus badius]
MANGSWHTEAKSQWDARAEGWQSKSAEMWERGSRKGICPFFSGYVPQGSRVADLGCGDGYGSRKLHQSGYEVIGIDLSNKMVQLARRFETEGLTFRQGDLSSLPFADEELDAVMAINSLEWTENPSQVLAEIRRVLKPSGRVCAAILGPTAGPRENSYKRLSGEAVIMNTMMPWEFARLAADNGFVYMAEEHVYKGGITEPYVQAFPAELKQSLTFFTLFMIEKA